MKVAIIGSRGLTIHDFSAFLPTETDEIVTGGAKGIDKCAEEFAERNGYKLKIFYPAYKLFGRAAPLKRNLTIIDYADLVLAFWDGNSKGTKYVIDNCKKRNKPVRVIRVMQLNKKFK